MAADIRGNFLLEALWITIPTVIAMVMFISGWQAYTGLRDVPENAMEIEVLGQSFSWIFIYDNDKETGKRDRGAGEPAGEAEHHLHWMLSTPSLSRHSGSRWMR